MPFDEEFLEALAQCPEQKACPPPPPRSVCGMPYGAEIHLEAVAPDALTVVTVKCGEFLDGTEIKGCVKVEAHNVRDEQTSTITARDYPLASCVPVPEPFFSIALLVGVLWLGAAATLGPVLGGILKRCREEQTRPVDDPDEPPSR